MKKNNKGFMLIEVIITSTIVLTTMILLYSSFNKLSNSYKIRNSYYNIDASYATKEMINSMLKDSNNNNNINQFINDTFYRKRYGYIIDNQECKLETDSCDKLKTLYSIENMIFSEYDPESLKYLKENELINQTFKEYIEYIDNYYDIKNTKDNYEYIILTEVKENDKYYYASLRMR